MKQIVTLEVRNDPAGLGHYGAPRGSKSHRGVDYACQVERPVLSPVSGPVTRIGWCYPNSVYRYVEVTNRGLRHRFFYVQPSVGLDDFIEQGDPIGVAQDITIRYPDQGMTPHIHYEVKDGADEYRDPGYIC